MKWWMCVVVDMLSGGIVASWSCGVVECGCVELWSCILWGCGVV